MTSQRKLTRKRSAGRALHDRRVQYTAEQIFVKLVSDPNVISAIGSNLSVADLYANNALSAAKLFWERASPVARRTRKHST